MTEQVVFVSWDSKRPRRVEDVLLRACRECGCTREDLLGDTRTRRVVSARRLAAIGLRRLGYSTTEIGQYLNRHHSAVLSLLGRTKRAILAQINRHMNAGPIPVPDLSGEWAI